MIDSTYNNNNNNKNNAAVVLGYRMEALCFLITNSDRYREIRSAQVLVRRSSGRACNFYIMLRILS